MTLRGVIQGLMRGADDPGSDSAEAMLADQGFGDLPAEMFGQALASYADTAPMAEADALTPVLASLESGDPSDVFAVLEERPLVVQAEEGLDGVGLAGVSLAGSSLVDDSADGVGDLIDDDLGAFGESVTGDVAVDEAETGGADDVEDDGDGGPALGDDGSDGADGVGLDDPFAGPMSVGESADDDADSVDSFEDLFETEPSATGDDPADLDLDF